MSKKDRRPRIIIVGGGLVGALNSIYFGRTGKFQVLVCEKRPDIREDMQYVGRSINLTLSCRGLSALQSVGLKEQILDLSIPISGITINHTNAVLNRIVYGNSGEQIFAINRKDLNQTLLTEAANTSNVQIKFNTKLIDVDFSRKVAKFSSNNEILEEKFDLLVGNDGSFSSVRYFMSKNMNLDFSQEYLSHGWKEIYFPPTENNSYAMDENYLHLWPRNNFMLLALPNLDGSFTGILFMPLSIFESLKSSEDLFQFFERNFPEALEMIGRPSLKEQFFSRHPLSMVTIKCNSYNYGDACVIMGDAAHAMVPFYAQGVNTGFEDLQIFHDLLEKNNFKFEDTCSQFTKLRNQDCKVICDLSLANYGEMRNDIITKLYSLRKVLDKFLNSLFPSFWIPLYSMLWFTSMPYTECIKERNKQDKILIMAAALIIILLIVGSGFGIRNCLQ